MKFATLYSTTRNPEQKNNIGESIIDLAMNEIYKKMGIALEGLAYIEKPRLAEYAGEPVILPIVKGFPEHQKISKAFPPNVIPVFLCWSLLGGSLNPEDVDYLKKYEPIGCRDEQTLNECIKYGIEAYFNGCITACLPNKKEKRAETVCFVDIPREVEKYIPDELRKQALYLTHEVPGGNEYEKAQTLLEQYATAKLVVTSRLHAAIPCVAMGTPVILVKKYFSSRFMLCDRFLPVYDESQYDKIAWYPEPMNIEEYKNNMISLISARLNFIYHKETTCKKIDLFNKERPRREGVTALTKTIPFIEKLAEQRGIHFRYSLWGITVLTESFYQYIQERYPHARLVHVYDKYRKLEFHGLETEPIENIMHEDYGYLIVCPMTGPIMIEMERFLQENKQSQDCYHIASDVV